MDYPNNQSIKLLATLAYRKRTLNFETWLKDISPQYQWDVPHLKYMRQYIDRIIKGESLQLMILAPPRHGKTVQNTVHLAAFYLYKFPHKRVIVAAHGQSLANDFSRDIKILSLDCMSLAKDKMAVNDWKTEESGGLKPVGVGTAITGRGADLIIIDDPIRGIEQAYSKKEREKLWKWYTTNLFTRREPGASIILTMTPWHYDDLAQRILKSDDKKNWTVVKIPAIAQKNDPIGRKKGEALWPERYDIKELKKIEDVTPDFEAQYQLNPVAVKGNIIKRDWFIEVSSEDWPIVWHNVKQYYDTAFKEGEKNDYSVCITFGFVGDQIYIRNIFRGKLEFYKLEEKAADLAKEFRPTFIGVEDKASGQSLVQSLPRRYDLPITPQAIKIEGDKIVRAKVATSYMYNKKIFVPKNAPWLADFLDEACMFPASAHDDQVDALTLGLNDARESGYNLDDLID